MFRFYTSADNIHEGCLDLEQHDFNHIKNVLRMRGGEHIIVCDKEGHDYECELYTVGSDNISAKIISRYDSTSELDAQITLYQGLPKKDKMELIIQKAVELGAAGIVPVDTAHTVVKIDSGKEDKLISRWQSISLSAAKQSGRGIIPRIYPVMKFDKALKEASVMDGAIIPYEKARGIDSSKKVISNLRKKKKIAVFIGPEGGFSAEEINKALAAGVVPITLGHRILRTETAGLTILSILMFELEKDGMEDA